MRARKIDAMHKLFGEHAGQQCKGCSHLISGVYHDKRYHKCCLYGMTHSEATDWRVKWGACGMYNNPVCELWRPVIETLDNGAESMPLEGQMTIDDVLVAPK